MLKLRRTRLSLTGLASLAVLTLTSLSSTAFAQTSDAEGRWYQIEVILFTHENSVDDETSRNDVTLDYPANWVELKDPNAAPAVADDPLSDSASVSEPAPQAPAPADINRDPFYKLPGNLRELGLQADALKRSKSHRLLFHEAWRQPVSSPGSAPAIVVSAGNRYDDHRELEGSFSVSVSRYLHLSTHLWLSEFTRFDAEADNRDYWPELPQRPAQKQVRLDASLLLNADPERAAYSSTGWDSDASPWQRALQLEDNFDFSTPAISKTYTPAQISVLQQQRRMRSGEVHYLDHPHMGMVILIKPYEIPATTGN